MHVQMPLGKSAWLPLMKENFECRITIYVLYKSKGPVSSGLERSSLTCHFRVGSLPVKSVYRNRCLAAYYAFKAILDILRA